MSWLLVVVLAILAGYSINGRRRGFIKTVFTLFSTIVALVVTVWVSPVISKEVQQNDKIMSFVNEKVSKVVEFKEKNDKESEQESFIDKLLLPKSIKKTLTENNTTDVYKAMAVDSFEDYISGSISRIVINAGVFLIIMLILTIGLALLCEALNIISKLPIINGLNKSAGLFAGFLHGIIIVWIGCIFLTMLSSSKFGQTIFVMINDSPFLSTIYNNNLILQFVTNLGTTLF
jgi:uncharacterized membrane protein required for colicin V production